MDVNLGVNQVCDEKGERIQEQFYNFINEFVDESGTRKYRDALPQLFEPERNTFDVRFDDLYSHSSAMASGLELEFYRLYPYVCKGLHEAVLDAYDTGPIKANLRKKAMYVSFSQVRNKVKLRELTAGKIGTLTRISGQVVRTHPVHPELCKGSFTCDDCGAKIQKVEQHFKYTPPTHCVSGQCQNQSRFQLNLHESLFIDFQKIRIQETQAELPRGSIPLSLDVIVRGELVETVQPGDRCDFIGTLIVIPDVAQLSAPGIRADVNNRGRGRGAGREQEGITGLRALGVRDMNYRLAFLVCSVTGGSSNFGFDIKKIPEGSSFHKELWAQLSEEERNTMKKMCYDKNISENLMNSLFPDVFGNVQVKQGVLLMLFGGVQKKTAEGTTLRGDINVCLIGDPSTAKSQILKCVERFSPRAVYTSGKASSAAGLTAAVVKDEESSEFVIEAGALMLADNGVCCIDEFDKMDTKDQVAIHEAMEQQTISITKAGVKATLNARASVLAAANPIGGRYDRSRTLKQNIQLSAPIMSRFDLFFVMVDTSNAVTDREIARRVLDTHRCLAAQNQPQTTYKLDDLRKYIKFARCFNPLIEEDAAKLLVAEYRRLRLKDSQHAATSSWRITVRQLESLIRLSEALARLHCKSSVTVAHVMTASELLSNSLVRIEQPDVVLDEALIDAELERAAAETQTGALKEHNEEVVVDVDESESTGTRAGSDSGSRTEPTEKSDASQRSVEYATFKQISDVVALRLKQLQEQEGEENWNGIRLPDLVQWYLEVVEPSIQSVDEYRKQKSVFERIVNRLMTDDNMLIQVNASSNEEPIVVLNPNYQFADS